MAFEVFCDPISHTFFFNIRVYTYHIYKSILISTKFFSSIL